MRKLRLLVLSILLACPVVVVASPAHACTDTTSLHGCDAINRVCERAGGKNCLG